MTTRARPRSRRATARGRCGPTRSPATAPAFEIRTYRRVQRFLFFNNFPDEPTAGANRLVRSLDLTYSDQQTPADPHGPSYTFLVSVTETGYGPDGQAAASMPPLEFDYSEPVIGQQVLTLDDPDSKEGLPEGLDGRSVPVDRPGR